MKQPLRITPQVQIVDPSGRTTRDGFNLVQGILDQLSTDSGPIGTALQPSDIGVTVQAHSSVLDATTAAYTATKDTKLAGIAPGATVNSSDAFLLARANHTGTESADVLTDGTTNKAFLATERTKLAGIAAGATANSSDATLLARANHTGTESADVLTDGTTNKAFLATERTKLSGIATGADVTATAVNATAKGTPVDADRVHGSDSASSFGLVYATWTQVKAFLKTYFDTLYPPIPTTSSWTPTAAFATPGTSSFAYSTQEGVTIKIGKLVFVRFRLVFTPTIGTGSGFFNINGLLNPASASPTFAAGGGSIGNISSTFAWGAGYTQIVCGVSAGTSTLILQITGSAVAGSAIQASNMTTGASHTIVGSAIYEAT